MPVQTGSFQDTKSSQNLSTLYCQMWQPLGSFGAFSRKLYYNKHVFWLDLNDRHDQVEELTVGHEVDFRTNVVISFSDRRRDYIFIL